MNFLKKNLHAKMLIAFMGCLLLVSIGYIPLSIHWINRQATVHLDQKIDQAGDLFTGILEIPLWQLDQPAMIMALRSMLNDPNVLMVALETQKNVHLYTIFQDPSGSIRTSETPVSVNMPEHIERVFSIQRDGEVIGYLRFAYSTDSLQAEKWTAISQYVLSTLFLFLAIFGGTLFVGRKLVVQPVKAVNAMMMRVAEGNYDESIVYQSQDEIGQMVTSFEKMRDSVKEQIEQVEQKKRQLEVLNAGLENKVQERTQTLQERSEALQQEVNERRQIEFKIRDMLETQEMISDNLIQTSAELQRSRNELEQKNDSLTASNRKYEDLNQNYDRILKKLDSMYHKEFPNLQGHLEDIQNTVAKRHQPSVQRTRKELSEIQEMLHTIAELYESNQAIASKRILLAENNRQQQIFAKMALSGTGVKLDIVSEFNEGKQLLKTRNYDIICTNMDLIELTAVAQESQPNIRSVFMTPHDASFYLAVLKKYPFLSNIVSRNDEDRTFTLKNIITTISKLVSEDLFGLEKYMSWGVEVQQQIISHSHIRGEQIETMQEYFREFGFRKGLLTRCGMVAEELLMNAIYDAPIDAEGQPRYNHLPRTVPVALEPGEQGLMRYACDGMLLAISVQDPFGAFGRKTILNYLEHCYSGEAGKLDKSKGGGGFGLLQIMETADLVVFNVRPKVKTEVITLFNLDPNVSQSSKKAAFHYFSI